MSEPETTPKTRGRPISADRNETVIQVRSLKAAGFTYAEIGAKLGFTAQNASYYGNLVKNLHSGRPLCPTCFRELEETK